MNFTDFYSKLFKKLYDCNFTLNLVKENDVTLLLKYLNFRKLELYGITVLVLAVATAKTSVYRISFKSVYFYYLAPLYWIRCSEFQSYEL